MLITGSTFISLSSEKKDEKDDIVTCMENAKRDGKRIMRVLKINYQCRQCKEASKGDDNEICIHYEGFRPRFHNTRSLKNVQFLMGSRKDDYITEIQGQKTISNSIPAFNPEMIGMLFKKTKRFKQIDHFIPYVYIGIDPAAQGSGSKYSEVAICEPQPGRYVILGVNSGRSHDVAENVNLVPKHIQRLEKEIKALQKCVYVIAAESNLGNEAYWFYRTIKTQISDERRVCLLKEDMRSDGQVTEGIRTSEELKIAAVGYLKELIEDGRISIHESFCTVSPGYSDDKMLNELYEEMEGFRKEATVPKAPHLPPRVFYTGKRGRGFDDKVMALLIALCGVKRFKARQEYASYKIY